MYSKEYYQKNKEKFLKWQQEYRKKNHDKVLENRRKYDKKNRLHLLTLKYQWRKNNLDKYKSQKKKDDKKYYEKMKNDPSFKEKNAIRHHNHYIKNRERILEYGKQHSQIPEIKARKAELTRIRRRNNPQSNRSGTIEIQIAMNNVRLRDHNSCQWQGCKATHRDASIHVHHIFPRSEYPDYEEIEQYMICYCANHHGYWHRMRGDKYSEMIPARYQENGKVGDIIF